MRFAPWAFYDIERTGMKRINVWYFYSLATAVRPLMNLRLEDEWSQLQTKAMRAFLALHRLEDETSEVPLQKCIPEKESLLRALMPITSAKEPRTDLGPADMLSIRWAAEKFETVLALELREEITTFFVPPIGIYSTLALLNKPEAMFLDQAKELPSETLREIREAGKCLAFGLATAAGFHLLRAVESVLRKYYDVLSENAPRPERASMGVYLDAILQLPKVDKDLESVLRQIKKLHRDPIAHPEAALTVPQAVSLLGLVQSAVSRALALIVIREIANTVEQPKERNSP
jgi:hypothetical protein